MPEWNEPLFTPTILVLLNECVVRHSISRECPHRGGMSQEKQRRSNAVAVGFQKWDIINSNFPTLSAPIRTFNCGSKKRNCVYYLAVVDLLLRSTRQGHLH